MCIGKSYQDISHDLRIKTARSCSIVAWRGRSHFRNHATATLSSLLLAGKSRTSGSSAEWRLKVDGRVHSMALRRRSKVKMCSSDVIGNADMSGLESTLRRRFAVPVANVPISLSRLLVINTAVPVSATYT